MKPARATLSTLLLGCTLVFGAAAHAAQGDADLTAGEVRKVDKDAKKITLKHEAIKNLDMPAMTMSFGVQDPALLDKVRPGDKVRFHAIDAGGGKLVVTELQTTSR
jgi:Cu/Ag efflux protein CusF